MFLHILGRQVLESVIPLSFFNSATAPGSLSRSVSQSSLGSAKFNPSSGSETDSMDSMVEKLSIESDSGVVLREKVLTRGFSQRWGVRNKGSIENRFNQEEELV